MKVMLVGAFGKLGEDILRKLVLDGHEVIAIDKVHRQIHTIEGSFVSEVMDVTKREELKGKLSGIDLVISTVGLTSSSKNFTNYDIDYQGNLNLLQEAIKAGVTRFAYVSVLKADGDKTVPMLRAKYMMEQELKKSGIEYVIFRPTGYFYDLTKVFVPMVRQGSVTLLGKRTIHANPIDTYDLARFIVEHMMDENCIYDIGGKETYSYEEIAHMLFQRMGITPKIKYVPIWIFDILAWVAKIRRTGKESVIRFSKWTLTNEMVAKTQYGEKSFSDYINNMEQK